MTIILTEEEFAGIFTKYPHVRTGESGMPICPFCGNAFSSKNLEYYNVATLEGTPFCSIEITCDVCNKVIWRGDSWYPGIEDEDELIDVADKVLWEVIEQ